MRFVLDGEMTKVCLGLVILAVAASSACATAKAKTAPERPTLDVPAPPAKVIETTPMPDTTPEPVPELPAEKPANPRTSKPTTTREPARDTKPEAPPTTAEAPPAPVAPVPTAPQLRPGGTPDPSEAAKQTQITIERARQALNSLNSKQFSKARLAVYESAKQLLVQADEAFKKSDFENAKKLAEKVESTARELQGR